MPRWRLIYEQTGRSDMKFTNESNFLRVKLDNIDVSNLNFIDRQKTKIKITDQKNQTILSQHLSMINKKMQNYYHLNQFYLINNEFNRQINCLNSILDNFDPSEKPKLTGLNEINKIELIKLDLKKSIEKFGYNEREISSRVSKFGTINSEKIVYDFGLDTLIPEVFDKKFSVKFFEPKSNKIIQTPKPLHKPSQNNENLNPKKNSIQQSENRLSGNDSIKKSRSRRKQRRNWQFKANFSTSFNRNNSDSSHLLITSSNVSRRVEFRRTENIRASPSSINQNQLEQTHPTSSLAIHLVNQNQNQVDHREEEKSDTFARIVQLKYEAGSTSSSSSALEDLSVYTNRNLYSPTRTISLTSSVEIIDAPLHESKSNDCISID
jgi:hypothetical protein